MRRRKQLAIGLNCTKIDAWLNDCMLYLGEDADRDFCKKCQTFRFQQSGCATSNKRKKIPAKVLRYFLLKPR